MPTVTRPGSPERPHSTPAHDQDADFEQRWAAWKRRGLVRERLVRQRVLVVAVAGGAAVLSAVTAYGLLAR
jgi:hypothetical protein